MANAARAIITAIRGSSHPVINLWTLGNWRFTALQDSDEDDDDRHALRIPVQPKYVTPDRFLEYYSSVPILPGDRSLIQDTITAMEAYIRSLPPSPDMTKGELLDRLHGPGFLLLQLVVLRTYLHREARDDDHIFHLWRLEKIVRIWTRFEQTLAASRGQTREELESHQRIKFITTKGERNVTFVDGSLPPGTRLVRILTNGGAPHIWPKGIGAGLVGEPLVFEVKVVGPPPKPRRLQKKPVTQLEGADGEESGGKPQGQPSRERAPPIPDGVRRSLRNRGDS